MQNSNFIEIQLNKSRIKLMLLGSIVFVVLGFYFMIYPERLLNDFIRSITVIFLSGLLGVIFFGIVGFYILKRLIKNTPGLIISNDGITDNSNGISAGFIPWSDIKEIKQINIASQSFINLMVKNPQFYINQQQGWISKKFMELNFKKYGAITWISSNTLKYDYIELIKLIESRFEEYRLHSESIGK